MGKQRATYLVVCNVNGGVRAEDVRKEVERARERDGVALIDVRGNVPPSECIRVVRIPGGAVVADLPVFVLQAKESGHE